MNETMRLLPSMAEDLNCSPEATSNIVSRIARRLGRPDHSVARCSHCTMIGTARYPAESDLAARIDWSFPTVLSATLTRAATPEKAVATACATIGPEPAEVTAP